MDQTARYLSELGATLDALPGSMSHRAHITEGYLSLELLRDYGPDRIAMEVMVTWEVIAGAAFNPLTALLQEMIVQMHEKEREGPPT